MLLPLGRQRKQLGISFKLAPLPVDGQYATHELGEENSPFRFYCQSFYPPVKKKTSVPRSLSFAAAPSINRQRGQFGLRSGTSTCSKQLVQNSRILKLDDQLSNQIAAGEVVERPGSALKELVENSLDAGAKNVRISLNEGGTQLLEVADDGRGIHRDDLLLALDRHATSKIRRTEDLFAIDTWGFRGEALASIAAVSRLTLSSRAEGAETGRELVVEGGIIREDRTVARPVGTTVRVEDLFFNTPARKKFQKSVGAESTFCAQTFHRLALGSPECAFTFTANGEKLFQYAAEGRMETRVAEVYRASWRLKLEENEILHLHSESPPLKLQAWILPSKHFIPSSRGILLYVNRRTVKDKLLQQSVLAAAKEALFGNLYPQLVLFLETPPDSVDVNVHPAKSEVRFRDSGHVFAFVRKYLERALAGDRRGSVENTSLSALPPAQNPALFESFANFHQKASENTMALGESFAPSPASYPPVGIAATGAAAMAPYSGPQFLGTLKNTYLVCQDENGLLLVDQHAAHERVTYEKLKKSRFAKSEGAPLLIPIQVELGRDQLDRLESEFSRFAELGLILDRTGPTVLAVRELPALLLRRDGAPVLPIGTFLRKLVQDWDESAVEGELAELFRSRLLDVLASESCHGSVRAGQSLSAQEGHALLAQMQETDFSGHCPHGRPTTVRFRWGEIERLFKRVF